MNAPARCPRCQALHGPPIPCEDEGDPEARIGQEVLGGYRIEAVLGRGGTGTVYRARSSEGAPVALKVLDWVPPDEAGADRWIAQAERVRALAHPSLVAIHAVGRLADGRLALLMELLEGRSLATRIQQEGALPEPAVLAIAHPLLDALDFAHRNGVVHGDVKPENVMLLEADDVVAPTLLDFAVRAGLPASRDASMVLGTPHYLAPEQARGEAQDDPRIDLWAVGVLMYEALTGVLPFNAPSYPELIERIVSRRPVPPRRFAPDLSEATERLILDALEADPDARPSSAATLGDRVREAIRQLRGGSPSRAGD